MDYWRAFQNGPGSLAMSAAFAIANTVQQIDYWTTKHRVRQEGLENDFTQSTVARLTSLFPDKNVIVYHDARSEAHLQGEVVHEHFELPIGRIQTQGYELVVFDSGTFDLAGDGGYRNWCFAGNWKREGNHVDFGPIASATPTNQRRRGTLSTSSLFFDFAPFSRDAGGNATKNSTGNAPSHTPLHAPVTHVPAPPLPPSEVMITPASSAPVRNGSTDGSHLVQCRAANGTIAQGLAYYKDLMGSGRNASRVPDDIAWLVRLDNAVFGPSAHSDWSLAMGAVAFAGTVAAAIHWRLFGNAANESVAINQTCGVADNGFEHFWIYKGDGERLFSVSGWDCDSLFYAF